MMLAGKVALVTGGGRGIGKAIAHALAKEGAGVVVCARTAGELKQTEKEIISAGGKARAIKCDVRDAKQVKQMVKQALKRFGRVDILVNNAGIAFYKPLVETSEREWRDIIETNLDGVFYCAKEVLSHMLRQKSGVIITISSGAGKTGFGGLAAYCATKFAEIGLMESLAEEVSSQGVRVYCVCPGGVDTRMYHSLFRPRTSFGLLKPETVARKVLELCLPDCRVRSGASIDVAWLY